jgi:hypothetical protein
MPWKDDNGAPGEIRTPDPLLRRQLLYPAELRARPGLILLRLGRQFEIQCDLVEGCRARPSRHRRKWRRSIWRRASAREVLAGTR